MRWVLLLLLPFGVNAQDTIPLDLIDTLPAFLEETSGLEFIEGTLWTFEDGGGAAELYQVDTLTGTMLRTVEVNGATNVDWEDIAADADFLYIGDFGNNAGTRTDLTIYRVDRDSVLDPSTSTVSATAITFNYADQTSFMSAPQANNFDCEAMVVSGGQISLFTKRWLDEWTTQYTIPASPGNHVAQVMDSMSIGGLVTGADLSDQGLLVFSCYRQTFNVIPFIWSLEGFMFPSMLNGSNHRWSVAEPLLQMEGIAFSFDRTAFVSSESFFSLNPARLWRVDVPMAQMTIDAQGSSAQVRFDNNGFSVVQDGAAQYDFELFDLFGRLIQSGVVNNGTFRSFEQSVGGVLILTLRSNGHGTSVHRFIR
jgi:hypothetical protein